MMSSNQKLRSSIMKRSIGAIAHTPAQSRDTSKLLQNVEKNKEILLLKNDNG